MSEEEVAVLAKTAGVAIDPAYLAGVARNLDILSAQAALLDDAPVGALTEPAPVFRP